MEVILRRIAGLLALLIIIISSNNAFSDNAISWQPYSNDTFDKAKSSNHLILLYFKSLSCHWCQEMDKTTWSSPDVIQTVQSNYIPVRIEISTMPELVKQYQIESLPTIILLRSDKTIVKIFSGYFAPDFMITNLKMTTENKTLPNTTASTTQRADYQGAHIVIVGSKLDPNAKQLYDSAVALALPNAQIIWWDKKEGPLLNSDTTYPTLDKSAAYVCYGHQCSFPLFNSQDLLKTLQHLKPAEPNKKITPPAQNQSSAEKLLNGKNWILIIFGFIGFGLLLSFTPCVLPLIPIMASIIVGPTIGVKKQRTFLLCLSYVLAMSFTYAIVGLLAGIFGVYLQLYMQLHWVIILFSLVFLTLGFSMLGAFELRLPNFLQQKIYKKNMEQEGGTYFGVISMGILGTLIISPCVTAPLAGILSFIAHTSNYVLGSIGLFCLGLGMGLPLLIVSVFSKNILPKAVHWNHKIKTFFGILLLAIAVWVLNRILSQSLSLMFWSALLFLICIYMGITKSRTKTLGKKLWKTASFILFTYAAALFFYALYLNLDSQNLIQKQISEGRADTATSIVFKTVHNDDELQQALVSAKAQHKPILLDFSASWCTACVEIDKTIFHNPDALDTLNKFILLRVDLTNIDDANMKIAHQFHVVAPPIVLFYDNQGELTDFRITGDVDANQFIQIAHKVLAI